VAEARELRARASVFLFVRVPGHFVVVLIHHSLLSVFSVVAFRRFSVFFFFEPLEGEPRRVAFKFVDCFEKLLDLVLLGLAALAFLEVDERQPFAVKT
jgi:hypothetical protein